MFAALRVRKPSVEMSAPQTRTRFRIKLARLLIERQDHESVIERTALQLRVVKALAPSTLPLQLAIGGDPLLPRCELPRLEVDAVEVLGDLALLAQLALLERLQVLLLSNRWSFLSCALGTLPTLPTLGALAIFCSHFQHFPHS